MAKTSTDIRGHNRKKKEKAAPCLGVQALDGLGTFHHPVISGSGDRAPDRMETEGLRGQPSPVGLPLARSLLRRSPAPALPASWPSIASSSVPPQHRPAGCCQRLEKRRPFHRRSAAPQGAGSTVPGSHLRVPQNPTPREPCVFAPNALSCCGCY